MSQPSSIFTPTGGGQSPEVMIAAGGWDRTVYVEQRPVLVSPSKVHIVVDYTRNRADGSVISRHQNLWVVTRQAGRWGVKQRSY